MELSVCEPVLPSSFYLLPSGESLVSPSGASYVCLQRLATQSTPISPNASIVQFPPNVGLPLNGDRLAASMASSAVLLTVEYLQDFHLLQDNSGFDLYLSDEPLPIEAGIMAVGLVPDHRFIVPPNVSEWTTAGTCHSSCLADVSCPCHLSPITSDNSLSTENQFMHLSLSFPYRKWNKRNCQ